MLKNIFHLLKCQNGGFLEKKCFITLKCSDQSFLGVTFGLFSFRVCLSQMYYRHGSKPAKLKEQTHICLYYFIVLPFCFIFRNSDLAHSL